VDSRISFTSCSVAFNSTWVIPYAIAAISQFVLAITLKSN